MDDFQSGPAWHESLRNSAIARGALSPESTIPLRLWDKAPDGEQLVSIFNEVVVKGQDHIDLDDRNGLIAFGFKA